MGARRIGIPERENIHASVWVGSKLEVDCGPLASFLLLLREAGLPGAHVLAVVPAHRGTYAEVRGRCWLQISSRNALQKQRSDESEREPRWHAVPGYLGARVVEESSRLHAVAAKGHYKEARPRVA